MPKLKMDENGCNAQFRTTMGKDMKVLIWQDKIISIYMYAPPAAKKMYLQMYHKQDSSVLSRPIRSGWVLV